MTDKIITFAGAVPLETDLGYAQRGLEAAVGYALEAIMGTTPQVIDLQCSPTTPASMQLVIQRGMITQLSTVDATPFGSLPADGSPLVKAGINVDPTTLTFVAADIPGHISGVSDRSFVG